MKAENVLTPNVVSHYRIIRSLGTGGMGEVFLAEDTRLQRQVAIKGLRGKAAGSQQAQKRLIREAKAAATLDHPNICAIHEIAEEGERTFIVMQYVEGETLADRLHGSPLDIDEAVEIAAQIAGALAEAHSHGIVHRDIKPQNVMITPRGQVKVLDFGLAKLTRALVDTQNETQSLLTDAGMAIGTVHYMSPEQARGEQVDARSDLFSLGSLLYKCVTGRTAFSGNNSIDVCAQVIHVDPQAPSGVNPLVPPELERIILRALAKNVDSRYQSAREMFADLRDFHRAFLESRTPVSPRSTAQTDSLSASSLVRLLGRFGRGSLVRGVVVIALPVAILAVWLAFANRGENPHQPTAAAKRWYEIGTAALRDGVYYQASKALEHALELDGRFALAHARLAEAYAEIDNTDRATEELLFATSLVPNRGSLPQGEAMYLDAILATVRRDFADAIDHYLKIAEQAADSDKASAYVDLGRSYEKNENLDKAIESYKEGARLNSQSAAAFLRLGILYGRQQKLNDATVAFNEAEKLYNALSNPEGITEVLYQRGTLLTTMGKFGDARARLEKAQATANNHQQIRVLLQLSNLSRSEGNTAQAQDYAKQAIERAKDDHIESLAASGLNDLGTAFFFRGEHSEAENYFKQALDLARRSKARRTEARALLMLGSLSERRGDPDEAIAYIDQALAFYQLGGYKKETSLALIVLGRANRNKGDYEAALQIFQQQLQLAKETGDASQLALSYESIGILLGLDQERYSEGLSYLDESYKIAEAQKAKLNIGYLLMNRGWLLWLLGRYPEARSALNQAFSIAGQPEAGRSDSSYKELMAWVFLSNAQMALTERQFALAIAKCQQGMDVRGVQNKEMIIKAKYTLGLARALSGASQVGKKLCEEAVTLATESRNPSLAHARLALAEVLLETHNADDALRTALQAQESFAKSGQQDSEWRAWLIAARATQLAGNDSQIKEYASRADSLLSNLQQKWGPEAYNSYLRRRDVETCRKQINQLLAINK